MRLFSGHASGFRVFRVFRGYSPWLACALGVAACLALAGCETEPGPADYAQATAISRAAAVKAIATAQAVQTEATVTAQAVQIQATVAAQAAAERQATAGARILTIGLLWLALGLFAVILAVGGACVAVAWLARRAAAIYPNRAGLYPVITQHAADGSLIVHDPNRAIGASTVYHCPSVTGALAKQAGLDLPAVTASGQDASEAAQVQVAGQAQAVSLMAAAAQPASWLEHPQPEHSAARELAQRALSGDSLPVNRMPTVRQVNDPVRNTRFVEMLKAESNG